MDKRIMTFENSVLINLSVQEVFQFVTDFNNNALWQTDILMMEMTPAGHFGQGTTYRCANRFMGKRIETEGLVTAYEPDLRCCIRITSGPVTGTTSLNFEAVDGGTKFTTVGSLDLTYFKLARLLVKRKIKQQLKNDMDKLKDVLENGTGR